MKVKSSGIITLLIMIMAFLLPNFLQSNNYISEPLSDALGADSELHGGVFIEYSVRNTTDENYDILLEKTVAVMRLRLGNSGFTEATVAVQDSGHILVEIPDVDDPEQIAEIIGKSAHLEFRDPYGNVVLDGSQFEDVAINYANPEMTLYGVGFVLNHEATAAFEAATREFMGQSIGIYLDDELISDPIVTSVISDGRGIITGSATNSIQESYEWAYNLTVLIQSGALPLDIEEVAIRVTTATQGE